MALNVAKLAAQVARIYNEQLGDELDPCLLPSSAERVLILERWRQMHGLLKTSDHRELLDGFVYYFRFVRRIDYIMGRSRPYKSGRSPFRANLYWLMLAKNFNRIICGSYTHRIGKKNLNAH